MSSGVCNACKQSLEPVKITADELRKLKTVFFHQVVKGRNIYEKTSAPEWDAFTQFIQENGPFDLVVDGLNIAHKVNNLEGVERSRPCGFKVISRFVVYPIHIIFGISNKFG